MTPKGRSRTYLDPQGATRAFGCVLIARQPGRSATMTNEQATNWLIALMTGSCHPLEAGSELREDGCGGLVVTLPEETSTGEVRFVEFRVNISRI